MITIEILDRGGIYAYYEKEECLYIGKTETTFSQRDGSHLCGTIPFDLYYQENRDNITMRVLYDCNMAPTLRSSLDYLETCFIQALRPKMNKSKIEEKITNLSFLDKIVFDQEEEEEQKMRGKNRWNENDPSTKNDL